MKLGDRLRKLRSRRKISQQELSHRLNINRVTYSQYETNRRHPDYETLQKLSEFFSVSTDYLLGREEHQPTLLSMEEFLDQDNIMWDENTPAHPEGIEYFKQLLKLAKLEAQKNTNDNESK
ncbi:helix-turn-helix domain-containing protein [Mechercharimyces sp. CAU 1602]|uniref:helix-turn-helix domain-containing protein n=1 Tax=Mechercharimyces sp. CAU 1602 TaxID=2973933 RepID=UPI002163E3BC|nr:helix-turn-helix transcriptional regulator [Mechercharimyces sp. CAU 1602]MCS1351190.1 helix-turn-helix domain-containing protein [Mechercharimyces sp. CAU 1602]